MTDTYEVAIDLDHDRDRVWQALTEPALLEKWFCEHSDVDLDAGRFDFWGRFTPGVPDEDEGHRKVLDVEPGRSLRFAWRWRGGDTVVTISLEGDTTVRVVHEGVPVRATGLEHVPSHLWSGSLNCLRALLDTGHAGPRFDWSWPHRGGFRAEADVRAERDAVWRALVDDGWLHPENPLRRPARNDDEDFAWDVGVLQGVKILDVTPGERFSLAWIGDHATVLTYDLSDAEGQTHITIVHSGFDDDVDIQGMAEGFFSGVAEVAWQLEAGGAWDPAIVRGIARVLRDHSGFRA